MLQNVGDVIKRAGVYLDDPSNRKYTAAVLMPFIDGEYDMLDTALERMGMQYIETIVNLTIPANTSDLSSYLADGQALQYMKLPKWIDWKLPGDPDTLYRPSEMVDKLAYVDVNNMGAWQWKNAQGSIQVTPSSGPIVLNIGIDTMSTQIYDPAAGVIRGTALILALKTASTVLQSRGDLTGKRGAFLERMGTKAAGDFFQVLTKVKQTQKRSARPIHNRNMRSPFFVSAAGASNGDGDLS
jgi:hypothetical protein